MVAFDGVAKAVGDVARPGTELGQSLPQPSEHRLPAPERLTPFMSVAVRKSPLVASKRSPFLAG